jgi:hypothetical protein
VHARPGASHGTIRQTLARRLAGSISARSTDRTSSARDGSDPHRAPEDESRFLARRGAAACVTVGGVPHRRAAGARGLGCLALAAVAACRVTDQRFVEPPGVPRLIAPASVSRVTRPTPTLRWVLGAGEGTPAVELCKDRACTVPLPIDTAMADDRRSAVPIAPLPLGWVYWRVRVARGGEEAVSATWQFWVGRAPGGTPVEVEPSGDAIFDVNGDGYADLLVAAPGARSADAPGGVVHVYLGSAMPSAGEWNAASSGRRIDVRIPANVPQFPNLSLAAVGDVNGDGFADFIVGAPFTVGDGGAVPGVAYLYLGSAGPSAERWNGGSPRDRIELADPDGLKATFGRPAVAVGDVNRDGYADFLITSSVFGLMQPAHVYLGSAAPGPVGWAGAAPPLRIDLSNPAGVNGVFATAASAGDVNGDGFADFVIGTSLGLGSSDGSVHVYLGSATPDAATWNGDSPGARIDIADPDGPGSRFYLVGSAGDVNGDGLADLLIGAGSAAGDLGAAHVYLGSRDPAAAWAAGAASARIDLTSPDTTTTRFGDVVSCAGDVNGDGLSDFVVSGFSADFTAANAGTAHVYLGVRTPSVAMWNGASPKQRIDVIAPDGVMSAYGDRPALAGDINGDLADDFVVSSLGAAGNAGAVYVYFGAVSPSANRWNGVAPADRLTITGPDPAASLFGTMR